MCEGASSVCAAGIPWVQGIFSLRLNNWTACGFVLFCYHCCCSFHKSLRLAHGSKINVACTLKIGLPFGLPRAPSYFYHRTLQRKGIIITAALIRSQHIFFISGLAPFISLLLSIVNLFHAYSSLTGESVYLSVPILAFEALPNLKQHEVRERNRAPQRIWFSRSFPRNHCIFCLKGKPDSLWTIWMAAVMRFIPTMQCHSTGPFVSLFSFCLVLSWSSLPSSSSPSFILEC